MAAGVTAALGHWVDTGVILGVVVINAIIGVFQEGKAEQALAGIRKMLSVHAQARRGGDWAEIAADELVPGDIVRLRSGDRVPADVRLLEAVNLRIEESALTGESVPAGKKTEPAPADAGIGDRHGMAYSGTMVAVGRGTGVVTATGPATELGRTNQMISEVQTLATPLTRQMNRFGRILSLVIVGLAVLQLVFVYAPFMHRLFGSTALELPHWLVPLGIGLAIFLLVEAGKAIFRRFGAAGKQPDQTAKADADAKDEHSKRAYALWEQAGRPAGREQEFWKQAEANRATEPGHAQGGRGGTSGLQLPARPTGW